MSSDVVLPASFPCWVRAIFSWSGECKQDLGFVEGDLIECLNAGDGQWWFGRLKRNHTLGLFPSNFVVLVDKDGHAQPSPSRLTPSAPNLTNSYVPPSPTIPPVPPPHRILYSYSETCLSDAINCPQVNDKSYVDREDDHAEVSDSSDSVSSTICFRSGHQSLTNQSSKRNSFLTGPDTCEIPSMDGRHVNDALAEIDGMHGQVSCNEGYMGSHQGHMEMSYGLLPASRSHQAIQRSFTQKTNSTTAGSNISHGSVFSAQSASTFASTFSATSAGSLARHKVRADSDDGYSQILSELDSFGLNSAERSRKPRKQKSSFLRKILGVKANEPPVSHLTSPDWTLVRRDVNRVNSLSTFEMQQRWEKLALAGYKVFAPVETLEEELQGNEHVDGSVVETPFEISKSTFVQVDKSVRFMSNIPKYITPAAFAAQYLCRPYRSDTQRLRAMFTFMTERFSWEPSNGAYFDADDEHSISRVLASRRGGAEEIAWCLKRMCDGVSLQCEVVQGYLKIPGEILCQDTVPTANHFWNAVVVDSEWRIIDATLASPTNPHRSLYTTSVGTDNFYFLALPSHVAYTHVAYDPAKQHLVPPMAVDVLLSLPYACPAFFYNNLALHGFNTSLLKLQGLELAQIDIRVPLDVECIADVETSPFSIDTDGSVVQSNEGIRKPALAQPVWENNERFYRIKGVLPDGTKEGMLKVYAGKKGFMHSIKDNPHPLALVVPLECYGKNAPFDFVTRHPCPHAQRHDLYITQPQCRNLVVNNTYIFSIRQHASSHASQATKPAKLALQSPSEKIMRIVCNPENNQYQMVHKVQETGVWRGLVLADRSARWCVFAEWVCS